MNKLSTEKRVATLSALVEGNSLRSTTRMTGVSINTVTKLLVDAGKACAEYQHDKLRNLPCSRVQCDEIWPFVGAKAKNIPEEKRGHKGYGEVWTCTDLRRDEDRPVLARRSA